MTNETNKTMETVNLNAKLRSKKSIQKQIKKLGYTNLEILKTSDGRVWRTKEGTQYVVKFRYTLGENSYRSLRCRSKRIETRKNYEEIAVPGMTIHREIAALSAEEKQLIVEKVKGSSWRYTGLVAGSNIGAEEVGSEHEVHVTEMGLLHLIDIDGDEVWKLMWDIIRVNYAKKLARENELENHICGKCGGTGYIAAFAWYANGLCFDCIGSGYHINNTIVEIEI